MTREEILKMRAGNVMNALVQVHVFDDCPVPEIARIPDYSGNMEAAWLVAKKFWPYIVIDGRGSDGRWQCTVWTGGPAIEALGSKAPLAICRAALLAAMRL